MESPELTTNDSCSITTPKTSKKLNWAKFYENNSPKMCGLPERQEEFGWDDSPEPLKFDPKLISGYSKKRLDCLESPVSSHSRKVTKRLTARRRSPSADKDLALIQELSRRIRAEKESVDLSNASNNVDNSRKNVRIESSASNSSESISNVSSTHSNRSSSTDIKTLPTTNNAEKEGSFDTVLQSFFGGEDDDELLSQVEVPVEPKPVSNKSKFVKSHSANQLESPKRSGGFQRSQSFQIVGSTNEKPVVNATKASVESQKENDPQPLKKQKSFHIEPTNPSQTQYSLADIERKRLEAKYRREFREIERKKLEAQKRFNERKARAAAEASKQGKL